MNLVDFCYRVDRWINKCLGRRIAYDLRERNFRFFEESTELVQACDMTREEAHRVVDYVFDRPVGELGQEAGGVMVCLAALTNARSLNLATFALTEVERIENPVTMDKIKRKNAGKPADVRG